MRLGEIFAYMVGGAALGALQYVLRYQHPTASNIVGTALLEMNKNLKTLRDEEREKRFRATHPIRFWRPSRIDS